MDSEAQGAAECLTSVYDALVQRRVSLLVELADIQRQMDDILLTTARVTKGEAAQ